ncbi:hypothetical protein RQP46_005125 [Phenoliferia psychrophenolica]
MTPHRALLDPDVLSSLFHEVSASQLAFQDLTPTLFHCTLVCRTWREPAESVLYRHVLLTTPRGVEGYLATSREKRDRLTLLKVDWAMGFGDNSRMPNSMLASPNLRTLALNGVQVSADALLAATELKSLSLSDPDDILPSTSLATSIRLSHFALTNVVSGSSSSQALISTLLTSSSSSLTSLDFSQVNDILTRPSAGGSLATFSLFLPVAPSLHTFSIQIELQMGESPIPPYFAILLQILETATSLQSLSLVSIWPAASDDNLFLATLRKIPPGLTTLDLGVERLHSVYR